jgi:hypothetical protein
MQVLTRGGGTTIPAEHSSAAKNYERSNKDPALAAWAEPLERETFPRVGNQPAVVTILRCSNAALTAVRSSSRWNGLMSGSRAPSAFAILAQN